MELFKALDKSNTSVKLFYVTSESINEATENMPDNIPSVPSTMRIHQVVTTHPAKLIYRDVSCMCSIATVLQCSCYNTQEFTFKKPKASSSLSEIKFDRPDVLGKWCIVKYEEDLYPGIIMATEEGYTRNVCTV
ncbi:hypothetical protein PDJAM_G00239420 [Pangasius djambal]|uniref:Uncharacterized protein n=1 Tax=Pangasius djambal TaxID=1691987 RepID=A0ACC5YH54_9TELE|nr:hypothetical protein [Pangasius djambal]